MTRQEIISEISKYFTIQELVCNHAYTAFGDRSWQFLNTTYLHCLLIIRRDILKTTMICNNWSSQGGPFRQRGLRCNLCELVYSKTDIGKLYLSAHILGSAGDFDSKGFTATQARQIIEDNQHLLPYPIRMEQNVTWLHFDTYDTGYDSLITYFKA